MFRPEKPFLEDLWNNADLLFWLIVLPISGSFLVIRLFFALYGWDNLRRKDSPTTLAFLLANIFYVFSFAYITGAHYGVRDFFEFLSRNTLTVKYEHSVASLAFWRLLLPSLLALGAGYLIVGYLRRKKQWKASQSRAVLMTIFVAGLLYGLYVSLYAIGYSMPAVGWVAAPIFIALTYLLPSTLVLVVVSAWYFSRLTWLPAKAGRVESAVVYGGCLFALFLDFVWLSYIAYAS
jgi:hypothetical protein